MEDFLKYKLICIRNYNENLLLSRFFQRLGYAWCSGNKFNYKFQNFYWDESCYTLLEIGLTGNISYETCDNKYVKRHEYMHGSTILFVDEFLKLVKAILINRNRQHPYPEQSIIKKFRYENNL